MNKVNEERKERSFYCGILKNTYLRRDLNIMNYSSNTSCFTANFLKLIFDSRITKLRYQTLCFKEKNFLPTNKNNCSVPI